MTREEAREAKLAGRRLIEDLSEGESVASLNKAVGLGEIEESPGFFKLALRVFDEDADLGQLEQSLSQLTNGALDVRVVGRAFRLSTPWHQTTVEPPEVGCSIGHEKGLSGTLGAFAIRTSDNASVLLSNNHVIARSNAGAVGDRILQPGPIDKGGRVIAVLTNDPANNNCFVELDFAGGANKVDAAIAVLNTDSELAIRSFGRLSTATPGTAATNTEVAKVGRTTGYRQGIVGATALEVKDVDYDGATCDFDDQIEILPSSAQNFASLGDSGALVFQLDGVPVGLLYAGAINKAGDVTFFANPLTEVAALLGITLQI